MSISVCPCGSNQAYMFCCGRYIDGQEKPPSPEALMRSRYTAYSNADINYIENTMIGPAAEGFDSFSARLWAESVEWLGLEVLDAPPVEEGSEVGFVEFIAKIKDKGRESSIREKSEFRYVDGHWYYYRGES